jgi:hypothetical protein
MDILKMAITTAFTLVILNYSLETGKIILAVNFSLKE